MAARKNKGTKDQGWDAKVKDRIQASMLVNRLQDHALGKVDMTQTQIRAAEIVLRKSLPDLSAVEAKNETTVQYIVRVPTPSTDLSEWQNQHAHRLNTQTLQ